MRRFRLSLLVPVVTFLSVLLAEVVTEAVFSDDRYYQDHLWPMSAGFLLASVLLRVIVERMAVPTDPEHAPAFWWIPLRYWSPLLAVLAGVVAVAGVLT